MPAAHVYLDKPSGFVAALRYEDFLREPVRHVYRVLDAARGGYVRNTRDALRRARTSGRVSDMNTVAETLAIAEQVPKVIRRQALLDTIMHHHPATEREYDHAVGASHLFDDATTDAIVTECASEMAAFGYSRDGVDETWNSPYG